MEVNNVKHRSRKHQRRLRREGRRWTAVLVAMTLQNLRTRWSGGIMQWSWALIQPLVQIMIYVVIFSSVMQPADKLRGGGQGYIVYLCIGYFCWLGFSEGITLGTTSLRDSTPLLKARPLPLSLFPLHSALAAWLLSAVGLLATLGLAPYLGIDPSWLWLLIPLPWLGLVVLTCGLTLILAPMCVLIRDTEQFIRLALPLIFWLTPIVYTPAILPGWAQRALELNPLNRYLAILHDLILDHRLPGWRDWITMVVSGACMLALGALVMRNLNGDVRDAI